MDRESLVFIAMGFEAVGITLGGLWVGQALGERFGWGSLAPIVGAFVGLIAWVTHLLMLARSFEKKTK
jgi:hypothetical protein